MEENKKEKFISQLASSLDLEKQDEDGLKEKYPCDWWKNLI